MFCRRSVCLLGWCAALGACANDPAELRLHVRWAEGRPELTTAHYIFLRVEERASGIVLARSGPTLLAPDLVLDRLHIENGSDRVAVAVVKASPWENESDVYAGASEPFDVEPNQDIERDLILRAVPLEPSELTSAAPARPDAARIVHRRAPWGTANTHGASLHVIVGEPGAAEPGGIARAYSLEEVRLGTELGATEVTADGSFELELAASNDLTS